MDIKREEWTAYKMWGNSARGA